MAEPCIGVFDSGVGGLTVLRELRQLRPHANVLYFADQAHAPYGALSLADIERYAHAIATFLMDQGAHIIVLACNTASAAALYSLRMRFPGYPFIGMEPAVKPAAANSQSRHIAVMATRGTFEGAPYAKVIREHAAGVTVHPIVCTGLSDSIEAGKADCSTTRAMLEAWLLPVLDEDVDHVVLGCTHYPFVRHVIESICTPRAKVIDPAAAVARQTLRILTAAPAQEPGAQATSVRYVTTSSSALFEKQVGCLLHETIQATKAHWNETTGTLHMAQA